MSQNESHSLGLPNPVVLNRVGVSIRDWNDCWILVKQERASEGASDEITNNYSYFDTSCWFPS